MKSSEIAKEINRHLPSSFKTEDLVVHRSFSGVIMATSRLNSGHSQRTHHPNSSAYCQPDSVSRVSPLMQIIRDVYYNDQTSEKYIKIEDDLNKAVLKKVQKNTKKHESMLEQFKVRKDSEKSTLRDEINKSTNRLNKSRFGKSNSKKPENFTRGPEVNSSNIPEKTSFSISKNWKIVTKRERQKSFADKLSFYVESPRMANRRIMTEHYPWNSAKNPEMLSTPENGKYYPRTQRRISRKNTYKGTANPESKPSIITSYLSQPGVLGRLATNLLLQIIKDEQNNMKPSQAEIEKFNSAVSRRMSAIKQRENLRVDMETYALKKINNQPTPKAESLISNFFS